ncbi:stage 0 sporulation family protein [Agrilactobacillus yilanensis]|uniref:Stage 0 sporulation family protein n=1 Tax=Agrilactobacillus yilanensis TaxID=2485997 RepID=A0ABW4J8N4_9LACO|nr:stage 0 sporulation family protein [Agrilactobacillus yilanensis]
MNLFQIKFHGDNANKLCMSEDTFNIDDQVVVLYGHAKMIATVTELMVTDAKHGEIPANILSVKHLATPEEIQLDKDNQKQADKALIVAQQKADDHHLKMKMIASSYALDCQKLLFYFTADQRVDFRELVRDLAAIYKTRIELRQIGVRDEAKILGGIGPCGRPLCCNTFLGEFVPVSIKMAKDQNLSLNPTKISGLCGRLMCCLQYEDSVYEDAKANLPDYGDKVMTNEGKGRVVGLNFISDIVKVQLEGHSVPMDYASAELKSLE